MLDLAREKALAPRSRRGPLRVGRRAQPPLRRGPLRRRHRRLRGPQLRRPRSRPARDGSGAAARRPAGRCSSSPSRAGRPSRPSTRSGSTASRRSSAGSPTIPRPTPTWPSRCAASPARAAWRRGWTSAGLEQIRYTILAGGIVTIHTGLRRVTRRSAVPPPVTAVLDASSRWLPARLGEVEELLREQAAEAHGELLGADARRRSTAGGKRLRPLLVLLCAGPGRRRRARCGPPPAVELVHMATLVHDDILDAAPLRRGQPTSSPPPGATRARWRPATCSSPAPSPCSRAAGRRPRDRAARRGLGGAGPR